MKKIIKLMAIVIAIFCSINITYSYFTNSHNSVSIFKTKGYSIKIDSNGGKFNSSNVSIKNNKVVLPTPIRDGYTFQGYSSSLNGNVDYSINVDDIAKINNKLIYAKWNVNSYQVDINPIIDGTTYNSGLAGYTFDVWVNGNLVADDVIDWCQNVNYGSTVRVKTNGVTGRNTSFDKTITVGTGSVNINPTWSTNTYESHFYLNGTHRLTTYNKYGTYINTPNTSASALGYDSNFYYVSGFTPWTTWYQPEYTVGFNIDIAEYNCTVSLGSAGASNARAQLTKVQAQGYNFCVVDSGWGALSCTANYSQAIALYNNAWNFMPRSGSGYSIYKQISCDSGYSTYARR